MYDGDMIYVSRSLRHMCGGSAMWFTNVLWWFVRCSSWIWVVAWGGLWCLVTLDLHGEGGARDLQR